MTPNETSPMQVIIPRPLENGRISSAVHMAAYEVYKHVYGEQRALTEGGCRGGFSVGEIISFLYARPFPRAEWRERVREALEGLGGIK